MKHLTLLICSVLSLSFSSINASTTDDNLLKEESLLSSTNVTHHVVYDITNKQAIVDSQGYVNQLKFTVTWLYQGPLAHPHIAYVVSVRTMYGAEIVNFQDSKRGGTAYGSKNYSITLSTPLGNYESQFLNYSIVGSDGSYM